MNNQSISWLVVLISNIILGAHIPRPATAEDFQSPPAAEVTAVAALVKNGATVVVDGNYRVINVTLAPACSDEDLKQVAACEFLSRLVIQGPSVTGEGLLQLGRLRHLKSVKLSFAGSYARDTTPLERALPDCVVSVVYDSLGILIANSTVEAELRLTDDQRQRIRTAKDFQAQRKTTDDAIEAMLTTEQKTRLRQIQWQREGIPALLKDGMAEPLRLTTEQRGAIRKAVDVAAAKIRLHRRSPQANLPLNNAESTIAQLKDFVAQQNRIRDDEVMGILTAEQRTIWENMLGPKVNDFEVIQYDSQPLSARTATIAFDRLDKNLDQTLTEDEFPASDITFRTLERSGFQLKHPITRQDFEAAYSIHAKSSLKRITP